MFWGTHLVDVPTSVDFLSGNSIAATAAGKVREKVYRDSCRRNGKKFSRSV